MNRIKKAACLALGTVLSVSLLAACGSSGSASTPTPSASPSASEPVESSATFTTVESGKLHMSTNAAFPPYEMVKDDGTFEGIDVDIATKIAEKLGLSLVVDDMDFTAAVNAPAQGKSDMCMAGLTITEDRKKNLDFSDSYATGVQVIIVSQDSDIQGPDDLKDKMIGTQEGTTGYIYCSDDPANGGYGEDHVIAYTNGSTAVQALLAGKVDAVVIDKQPAQEFVKANPSLKVLSTEYITEDYAIAVKKGNTELLDAINGALNELIDDGTVQSIVNSYIKAD